MTTWYPPWLKLKLENFLSWSATPAPDEDQTLEPQGHATTSLRQSSRRPGAESRMAVELEDRTTGPIAYTWIMAWLISLFIIFVGCGGASTAPVTTAPVPVTSPEAVPTQEQVEPPAPNPLEEFAGTYHITGGIESDGCGGRIHLAVENAAIDADQGTLFADVVDRTFQARVEDEQMIAEGRFERSSCPESTIFERWTMTRTAEGIEGTLESLWLLPPCDQTCLVVFHVNGSPSGPGAQ